MEFILDYSDSPTCNHMHPYQTDAQRKVGRNHVTTEIGAMWPRAKESLGPAEAGRGKPWIPLRTSEKSVALQHFKYTRLAARTVSG